MIMEVLSMSEIVNKKWNLSRVNRGATDTDEMLFDGVKFYGNAE
jgi:hypothetical protein